MSAALKTAGLFFGSNAIGEKLVMLSGNGRVPAIRGTFREVGAGGFPCKQFSSRATVPAFPFKSVCAAAPTGNRGAGESLKS